MATARRDRLALAAACVVASAGVAAAELGTLFHSPEERARLDQLRRGEPEAVAQAVVKPEVTGFVRRSDGRGTVWINGVPVPVAGAAARVMLDPQALRPPAPEDVRVERAKDPAVKR